MAQVTNITKTVKIPNEDESAVVRKLSHVQLRLAAKARQSEGVGFMRELGAELMKALRNDDRDTVKKLQDAQQADINNYDRDSLLRFGVVSWSYPIAPLQLVEPAGPTTEPGNNIVPFAPSTTAASPERPAVGLDTLDEGTAKFLADTVFEFSRPETKVEAKND